MHDVVIVGAGVIGSAVARELARKRLDIVVLERGWDAAVGASKANSGIVHGGYDAKPGTLKAKYNVLGNPLFEEFAEELDFPFKRVGSLVIAFSDEERKGLEALLERGGKNGVPGLRIIGRDELLRMEPHLGPGPQSALDVPTGGIVCPYEMTIAFAENAAANGVRFLFGRHVDAVDRIDGGFRIAFSGGTEGAVEARVVVNAAGVRADEINNMLSAEKLNIVPRRGEYLLVDRSEDGLVRHTLFQIPGAMGKGVLVTPSVDGNILVGPTADDIRDKDDVETTAPGMQNVIQSALRDMPLPLGKIIGSFAGLRAHEVTKEDFVVGEAPDVPGLVNVAGIESPGLTSAPALGREVAGMVADLLRPRPNPSFVPVRKATPRFRHMSPEERREAIRRDPNYGHMVCRCEHVTKAEILGALRSPLAANGGVRSLDAIKRRTRSGMGRCQGGFCSMRLPEIIAEETGLALTEITKFGGGSALLLERDKTAWMGGTDHGTR